MRFLTPTSALFEPSGSLSQSRHRKSSPKGCAPLWGSSRTRSSRCWTSKGSPSRFSGRRSYLIYSGCSEGTQGRTDQGAGASVRCTVKGA
ncbi:hypothetical protein BDZ85DRAFT_266386 [Elsinoe ampelina]|uniref:Uncharacterized protein n=1 Tax=Elsinoe ampelina TaxID=302913 RepID=A0A6A6G642_9PEZI|nr:hypothetical protein BDZ85DRAFT_266386 [Elsinoe ampelina]